MCATRAAPACASTARSCAGVRSSANRYAWIVFTPARLGGGLDRTAGTVRGSTAAVQAGAQRGQDLGDVAHQVVIDLGRVDHQQPAALRGQCRLDVLGAEPGEPVPVLDHDRRHGRVTQQGEELLAMPVERRPDLGHHPVVTWAAGRHLAVDRVVTEVGSALNGHRKKFLALLRDPVVTTIVVEHRDRFARFGAEYVEAALAAQGRRLLVVDPVEVDDDLVGDVTEILTLLCARLYGRRPPANRARRAVEAATEDDPV